MKDLNQYGNRRDEEWDILPSVSYTHLDVYKRQIWLCAIFWTPCQMTHSRKKPCLRSLKNFVIFEEVELHDRVRQRS